MQKAHTNSSYSAANLQPDLQETGREAMTDCAMQSGTCFVCPRCQGKQTMNRVPSAVRMDLGALWLCTRWLLVGPNANH
eukprot:1142874-Pelagomonas_calceolata.AAC.4